MVTTGGALLRALASAALDLRSKGALVIARSVMPPARWGTTCSPTEDRSTVARVAARAGADGWAGIAPRPRVSVAAADRCVAPRSLKADAVSLPAADALASSSTMQAAAAADAVISLRQAFIS